MHKMVKEKFTPLINEIKTYQNFLKTIGFSVSKQIKRIIHTVQCFYSNRL